MMKIELVPEEREEPEIPEEPEAALPPLQCVLTLTRDEEERASACGDPSCDICTGAAKLVLSPQSQKAQGVIELQNRGMTVPRFVVVQTREQLLRMVWTGKRFCRPCPPRAALHGGAKHGFVESRVCESREDALAVWDELAPWPGAEMLIMEPVEALCSGIWTSGMLTIGAGHDGATGGGKVVTFPTTDTPPVDPPYRCITQSPFFELVRHKADGVTYYVQMRDGPEIPRAKDWVPRGMYVRRVLECRPGDDLVAFDQLMQTITDPHGLVIWINGGGLASHFGVHGKTHGIAVVTTFQPQVGQYLAQTTYEKVKPANVAAFMDGVRVGLFEPARKGFGDNEVNLILSVARNFVYMDMHDPVQARWAGAACGYMLVGGFAASIGEARHLRRAKKSREQIYKEVFNNFDKGRKRVKRAWNAFLNGAWGSGFGGPKWAVCTREAVALWNSIVALQRKRPGASLDKCISQLNLAVDCAHNNGWWMNKFASSQMFDTSTRRPCLAPIECMGKLWTVAQAEVPREPVGFHWNAVKDPTPKAEAQAAPVALDPYTGEVKVAVQIRQKNRGVRTLFVATSSKKGIAGLLFGPEQMGGSWTGDFESKPFRKLIVRHAKEHGGGLVLSVVYNDPESGVQCLREIAVNV